MNIILNNSTLTIKSLKDYTDELVGVVITSTGAVEASAQRKSVKIPLNGATTVKSTSASSVQAISWFTAEPDLTVSQTPIASFLKRTSNYPVSLPCTIPSDIIDSNPTWIVVDFTNTALPEEGDPLNIILV